MPHSEPKPLNAIGFLTVIRHEQHGFFGGYLLLNSNSRPIEFHCTAPVKPNRAQEILYGPTLEPYLFGEQIGQALISKTKTKPMAVCTDLVAVLAVRDFVSLPVALVQAPSKIESDGRDTAVPQWRIDAGHEQPRLITFQLGPNRLAVPPSRADDRAEMTERLSAFADQLDLSEPFDRIRSAIEEAQRAAR
jgi:hypothetical protein